MEDEAGLRQPVRDYLRKQGYQVLEAADGLEALKLIEEHQGAIDALLTDVIMPHLNSPDLARNLKERFPKMKVIFMSGYAEDRLGGPEVFRDSVLLQKPFPLRTLRAKLQEILTAMLII